MNLHRHRDDFMNFIKLGRCKNAALDEILSKWAKLIAPRELKLRALLERINRKREEVESLRDGLFNATSMREASKSIEMAEISIRQNRYIFIFTVATVFYLPLGFCVFGIHLYDSTDPDVVKGRPKFLITIIVILVATWTITSVGY
ncbi:hypothetical protein L207DRAFT_582454 [Hyaloscypha variabilis F]|uniref:Uncharacterized protein n=1 Tax=Hyaloscypha variabilis (strain UAMH 11265 / GT02V1 / F) TaxID=1149755 RepID=A0A2J6RNZ4_HYAVF|nr:hypothetical protein L207DRAFT_582454 [Hyaloscypha variabilis F]